jgi:hypothetical protein
MAFSRKNFPANLPVKTYVAPTLIGKQTFEQTARRYTKLFARRAIVTVLLIKKYPAMRRQFACHVLKSLNSGSAIRQLLRLALPNLIGASGG